MKVIILSFLFTVFTGTTFFAQEFTTVYVKASSTLKCEEGNFSFKFEDLAFTKTNLLNGDEIGGPSKVSEISTGGSGYYFEIRSPKFIIYENGIDEYRKHSRYSHKILYDKKDGIVLYICEVNMYSDDTKFYLTKEGFELFCK